MTATPALGQNASLIQDVLCAALEWAELDVNEHLLGTAYDLEHSPRLVVSISPRRNDDQGAPPLLYVAEDGVYFGHPTDAASLVIGDEQQASIVAGLMAAAILLDKPFAPPECARCEEAE